MTAKGEKILTTITFLLIILCIAIFAFGYNQKSTQTLAASEQVVSENVIREEYFEPIYGMEADIIISLPKDEKGRFYIEEGFSEKEIRIVFENVEEDFFYQNKVRGNQEKIRQVYFVKDGTQTTLVFALKQIYKGRMLTKDGQISFQLQNPAERYERIFVFDGVSEEDREMLSDLLEPEMAVFFGGGIEAANELRADGYVCLEKQVRHEDTSLPDSAAEVVIYYNDAYYIPQFDSRDFAQLLKEHYEEQKPDWKVMITASDDELLGDARVPAVKIVYRTLQNGEDSESVRVADEEIQAILAEALIKQFGKMEEEK